MKISALYLGFIATSTTKLAQAERFFYDTQEEWPNLQAEPK
jgi:hypothetical protein